MFISKIIKYSIIGLLLVGLCSCDKDQAEVNTNTKDLSDLEEDYASYYSAQQDWLDRFNQASEAEVSAIQSGLQEVNSQQPFLAAWNQQYGSLFWNFATKDVSLNSSRVHFTVPLVKDEVVTAILSATYDGEFEFRLYERSAISSFVKSNPNLSELDNRWLIAVAKLLFYDLEISGVNQPFLTEWLSKTAELSEGYETPGGVKCDTWEVCITYISDEEWAVVYGCYDIITCGNSGGGPSSPGGGGTSGNGGSFPGGENNGGENNGGASGGGNNGNGDNTDDPDFYDPELGICGAGPCFECDFNYSVFTVTPGDCDRTSFSNLGSCTIFGQISHPGNGCGFDAFLRKSLSTPACGIMNIINDYSTAEVITSGEGCYIRAVFRGTVITNEGCFAVTNAEGTGHLGPDNIYLDYTNSVQIHIPMHQSYDIYTVRHRPIDSEYRCYHECGCY